jgi:hypothetical protein
MLERIKDSLNLISNMGWRYISFRIKHELLRRSGLLKNKFPVDPQYKQYLSLDQWKKQDINFFFPGRESLSFTKNPYDEIK